MVTYLLRAIADMRASREKELEQLPTDKVAAEKWINNGKKIEASKKNVTFEENTIDLKETNIETEKKSFDIFSKLKRKTDESEVISKQENTTNVSNITIFKEILEIKQSLNEVKKLSTFLFVVINPPPNPTKKYII